MKMQVIADRYGNVVATAGVSGSGDGAPSGGGARAEDDRYVVEAELPDELAKEGIDRLHYRFQLRFGDHPCLVDLEKVGDQATPGTKQDGVFPVTFCHDT